MAYNQQIKFWYSSSKMSHPFLIIWALLGEMSVLANDIGFTKYVYKEVQFVSTSPKQNEEGAN